MIHVYFYTDCFIIYQMKNIIFQVNGGIGKSIMATAVCRAIKKTYPDYNLIVLTGYPEVFIGNSNVFRFYRSGMAPYLYEDFVKGENTLFMCDEPYLAKGCQFNFKVIDGFFHAIFSFGTYFL